MLLSAVVAAFQDTVSAGTQSLPMIGILMGSSWRERPGLMRSQVSLRYRKFDAQYKRFGEWGLMTYGASQFGRSAATPSC